MRFCNTLQEYQSAKNQGTITDDLFVVILQDKLAKFKGQTFDWSENADLTALATKGELEALAEEIASNERVWAEALNDLNERINEIGTGGGVSSTEEIYIGETEPTDENVKVWINPNEQGSGGNGGGSASGGGVLRVWVNDENTPEQIADNVATYAALMQDAHKTVVVTSSVSEDDEETFETFDPIKVVVVKGQTAFVQMGIIAGIDEGLVEGIALVLYPDGTVEFLG